VAILLTGCHSTPKAKSQDYVDIPELPGTPIGTPVATNPMPAEVSSSTVDSSTSAPAPDTSTAAATSSPALSTPASALSTPAVPADATPTTAIAVATTQVNAAGSSDAPSVATTKVSQKHAAPATTDTKSDDVIRVGDALHISFSDTVQPLQPVDTKVREDGKITLMFDQNFEAAGRTPSDVEKEIRKRYVPDYFQQLTATVLHELFRVYYVDGEVRNPSKQAYTGPMTVTQAITSAGGFTDFANKRKVRLIRQNGKIEMVDCKKLIDHPEKDPEVLPGDKVHVPRSLF
jgi:polysaccharide export outer membrane protein